MLKADKINNENKLAHIAKALPYIKIKNDEANVPMATDNQTLFFIKSGCLNTSNPTINVLKSKKLIPADWS